MLKKRSASHKILRVFAWLERELTKLLRYFAASAVTTTITFVLLGLLLIRLTPGWAYLAAVGVGTIVSFELNRRWVWKQSSRRRTDLFSFLGASVAFLVLSTLIVHEVASLVDPSSGSTVRAVIVNATSLALFAVRWVLQYFLLDRVLFAAPEGVATP